VTGAPKVSATDLVKNSPKAGLTGVWEGIPITDCSFMLLDPTRCDIPASIAFTMIQQNSTVTGFYKCGSGTAFCHTPSEGGLKQR
jgi:hypothetical protein